MPTAVRTGAQRTTSRVLIIYPPKRAPLSSGTLLFHLHFLSAGKKGKAVLGLVLLATGTLILSGLDKALEATLVQLSPPWLLDLTTRF